MMLFAEKQDCGRWKFELDSPNVIFIAKNSYLGIDSDGCKRWLNADGYTHRVDGPAFEHYRGTKAWWINGRSHREDGPATLYNDGRVEWSLNGQLYTFDDWIKKIPISIEEKVLLKLRYG